MRYQICVSGAAEGKTIEPSHQLAYDVGREIAKSGKTLVTGATIGLPWFAAKGFMGVKDRKSVSIGFSPASSFREHVNVYHLPTVLFDYINFTGMHYAGRNSYLVRSSDAIIEIGGRMGSLDEFANAIESYKVVGVLLGSGGLADFIPTIIHNLEEPDTMNEIIFDTDPKRLVAKINAKLDECYADFKYTIADEEKRFSDLSNLLKK